MKEGGREWMKIFAALHGSGVDLYHTDTYRMGPTVWLDDGPIPIEKRSNVEMTACSARGGRDSGAGGRAATREEELRVDKGARAAQREVEVGARLVAERG